MGPLISGRFVTMEVFGSFGRILNMGTGLDLQ